LLQAVNRPDLTAKVHLCEVPLYVLAATVAIHLFGLTGAAIVWTMRLTVEALVLFVMARRLVVRGALQSRFVIAIALALVLVLAASIPMDLAAKVITAVAVLSLFVFLGWRSLLETGERQHLRTWFLRLSIAREWRAS
jgi:O-antigen/teichoic acid export membrane protein